MSRQLVLRCTVILAIASASSAATFTVTNPADAGPGTLRQAILDANASPGRDEIRFAATGLTFMTSPPVITSPVDINGTYEPGPRATVGATNSDFVLRFAAGSNDSTVRNTSFSVILEIDEAVSGVTLAANRFAKSVRIHGSRNLVGGTGAGEGNDFDGGFTYEFGREVADLSISGNDNEVYANRLEFVGIVAAEGNRVGSVGHGNSFRPEVVDYGLPMHHCVCDGGTALYLDSSPTVVEGNTFELFKACGYYPYPDTCGFTTPIQVAQSAPTTAGSQIRGNVLTSAGTCSVSIKAPASAVEILENPVIKGEICLSGDANHAQPAPALLDAAWVHGALRVSGTLTSAPNTAHIVELYGNDGVQSDWLDSFSLVTTSAGHATFIRDIRPGTSVRNVRSVRATATNSVTRDTSVLAGAISLETQPSGSAVPTLSQWSLLGLALGLAALVLVRLR